MNLSPMMMGRRRLVEGQEAGCGCAGAGTKETQVNSPKTAKSAALSVNSDEMPAL